MDGIWIIIDFLMKNEHMFLIILSFLLVILVTLLICFTICLRKKKKYHKTNKNKISDIESGQFKKFEEPWRWAGKQGENEANWIIQSVLGNKKDIDKAIHTFGRNRLSKQNVDSIRRILSACGNEWRLT